jgi:hypothetical protein
VELRREEAGIARAEAKATAAAAAEEKARAAAQVCPSVALCIDCRG